MPYHPPWVPLNTHVRLVCPLSWGHTDGSPRELYEMYTHTNSWGQYPVNVLPSLTSSSRTQQSPADPTETPSWLCQALSLLGATHRL